ncbi:flavin reductase family protein [Marinobacterium litorale]|uniref:flavin reductase family protein n=1 Tax=Marinobacterium litorale TaxID=404770 RepID=UPI0006873321|nr:iron-sulfur cluster-binding domain-containing protein [Marinobacterium litorale]
MARALDQQGASFELHYLCRSSGRAAFFDEMSTAFPSQVRLYTDDQPPQFDAVTAFSGATADTGLYICGPQGLIEALENQALELGWAHEQIHYELFNRSDSLTHESDNRFEIALIDTDTVIHVEADETALEALMRSGFEVPCSCEQGVCGSCLLEVVDGLPDHRDMFLTEQEREENSRFTPCCSRSLSPRLTVRLP